MMKPTSSLARANGCGRLKTPFENCSFEFDYNPTSDFQIGLSLILLFFQSILQLISEASYLFI